MHLTRSGAPPFRHCVSGTSLRCGHAFWGVASRVRASLLLLTQLGEEAPGDSFAQDCADQLDLVEHRFDRSGAVAGRCGTPHLSPVAEGGRSEDSVECGSDVGTD